MLNLKNLEAIMQGLSAFSAHDEVERIVDDNNEVLVQLERDQLSEGIDKDGNPRADSYAPFTVKMKDIYGQGIGKITDHVTFYMTGSLYESLFYKSEGDEFEFTSPLPTYDKMIERIGEDEFGLSPDKRLYFAEEKVLPKFAEIFKEKTTFVL
jgi:hypothetical protein